MAKRNISGRNWAAVSRETPADTVRRVTGFTKTANPELFAMVLECMATEMDKMAHKYRARMDVTHTNNVAYNLTQRAEQIRNHGR